MGYTSYTMGAYRDPAFAEQQDTDGCHLRIVLRFADAVTVTDAAALTASLGFTLAGKSGDPTYVTSGSTLAMDIPTYLPGGVLTVDVNSATIGGVLNGITCAGKGVKWQKLYTVVPTGLTLKTVSVTVGGASTPASTTIQITHPANVRSMNHILALSNGSSVLSGTDTTCATPAHHHDFWGFTKTDYAARGQGHRYRKGG